MHTFRILRDIQYLSLRYTYQYNLYYTKKVPTISNVSLSVAWTNGYSVSKP